MIFRGFSIVRFLKRSFSYYWSISGTGMIYLLTESVRRVLRPAGGKTYCRSLSLPSLRVFGCPLSFRPGAS